MIRSMKRASPRRRISAHEAVIGNEVWYSDGPPSLGASFTAAETSKRRDELLDLIARAYQQAETRGQEQLAEQLGRLWDKLNACRPRKRCGSLACVSCARSFQKAKVAAQESFLKQFPRSVRKLVFVSVIPEGMTYKPGQFANIDVSAANRWLKDVFKRLGLNRMILGSVDLGWESRRGGKYLQVHWHLAMRTTNPGKLEAKLKKAFHRFKKYERPIHVVEARDTGFLPYMNKAVKLPDLLRRNRTHLPEVLLVIDRAEPLDLLVLSKLRLRAQEGVLTLVENSQSRSRSKPSMR